MKKLYTLFLLLVLAACTHPDYPRLMAVADSLLYIRPDSALTILYGIPPDRLHTEEERMRHALLTVEAECRNRIPQRDDSLLRVAVDYYHRIDNERWEARGQYLHGYVLYNYLKEGGNAVTAYHQAEELAQAVEDKRLMARIYNGMAYIYQREELYQQADSLYNMVEQMAIQMKDTVLWLESVKRQSIHLIGQGKAYYKEAEQKLLRNYEIASRYNHPIYQCSNALNLSLLYSYMRNGERALRFAQKALELQREDTTMRSTAILLIGESFYKLGIYDSAAFYLNKVLASPQFNIRSNAYMRLSDMAEKQGETQKALEYEKLYNQYKEQYRKQSQTFEVQLAEHKYISAQKQKSVWYIVYYCVLAIIGLILIIIVLLVHSRKKEKASQQQLKDELLKQMQVDVNTELVVSPILEPVSPLPIEETSNVHSQFHFDTLQEQMLQTKVFQKLLDILSYYKEFSDYKKHFEKEDQKEWIEAVNQLTGGFIAYLSQKFPELDEEEIYFCSLHLFDFNPTEISIIMEKDRSGIYKKRKSLLKRKFKYENKTELKDLLKSI